MNKTAVAQHVKRASFLPHTQGNLQRKCACGNHTTAGEECAECAKKKNGLQRKLVIGASNDPLELEADRVAEQVMAAPARSKVSGASPQIQRFTGQSSGQMDVAPNSVDQVLARTGKPLAPALQQDMEQRFGHDFSRVRVHSDGVAEQSARDVNAHAYTVGHHVVFGAGQFAPETHAGRRLIAHELTHVVQQSAIDGNHAEQSNARRSLSPISNPQKLLRQQSGLECQLVSSDKLTPSQWLKCVSLGKIQPDNEYPLRFTNTGVVATPAELSKWLDREKISQEVAIARVLHSHEFAGNDQAREEAKVIVLNSFPMEKLKVCIRPVQIADDDGKKPTTLPSFDMAKTIWGKCCLDVSVSGAKTVSKTAYKTLQQESSTGKATAEEVGLFTAAGGAGGCISVFVAETFQDGGKISKDIDGGGATFGTPFGPAVVVVEGIDPTIVAHELGHAMDYLPHAPAGTIMEVTAASHSQKESDQVASVICNKVRAFSGAKPSGKKDCFSSVTK